jgi:hypothetical protein
MAGLERRRDSVASRNHYVLPEVVPGEDGLKEIQACHLITADGMNKDWTPPQK